MHGKSLDFQLQNIYSWTCVFKKRKDKNRIFFDWMPLNRYNEYWKLFLSSSIYLLLRLFMERKYPAILKVKAVINHIFSLPDYLYQKEPKVMSRAKNYYMLYWVIQCRAYCVKQKAASFSIGDITTTTEYWSILFSSIALGQFLVFSYWLLEIKHD